VKGVKRLQTVDGLPQIALFQQIHQVCFVQSHIFGPANFLQLSQLHFPGNGLKPELHAPRSHWVNYPTFSQSILRNVIANYAKPRCPTAVFNDSPQSALSVFGHQISLVQHYDLVRGTKIISCIKSQLLIRVFYTHLLRKCFNSFPHHTDAPVVRCVQLQHSGLIEFRPCLLKIFTRKAIC
jgi:hypothetical protein